MGKVCSGTRYSGGGVRLTFMNNERRVDGELSLVDRDRDRVGKLGVVIGGVLESDVFVFPSMSCVSIGED